VVGRATGEEDVAGAEGAGAIALNAAVALAAPGVAPVAGVGGAAAAGFWVAGPERAGGGIASNPTVARGLPLPVEGRAGATGAGARVGTGAGSGIELIMTVDFAAGVDGFVGGALGDLTSGMAGPDGSTGAQSSSRADAEGAGAIAPLAATAVEGGAPQSSSSAASCFVVAACWICCTEIAATPIIVRRAVFLGASPDAVALRAASMAR
jgi:hypothetical protein